MWLDATCNSIDIALKFPVQQYDNVGVLLPSIIEREWELNHFKAHRDSTEGSMAY